jgi:3-phenylpropionate/trans-cinnamate dioxygenase ferredoxin reductase component
MTMVGAESDPPHERSPLSKHVLAGLGTRSTMLRQRPASDELGAEWRLGVPAAALDPDTREVVLSTDNRVGYDGLWWWRRGFARERRGRPATAAAGGVTW